MNVSIAIRRSIAAASGLALLALLGCNGDDGGGLECRNGDFYLDGKKFTSCSQCSQPSTCSFETKSSYSYDAYGNRTTTSEVVTAHCAGESATLDNGVCK
jgi:hypothetical protein